MRLALDLTERGWIPDPLVRAGIRRMLGELSASLEGPEADAATQALAQRVADGPIARTPEAANAQHYEVPPAFFERALGPHLKYSCGLWEPGTETLQASEAAMLALTCERAALEEGQAVLELGCGWGSLTLWMAERYPKSRITAVSNSGPQRAFILERARQRGITNVDIITADINEFDISARFDRVVSVEMFEHAWSWPRLLARIADWMTPEGRLFVHHFCHRRQAYPYEDEGDASWMARHFFTGGVMPAEHWLERFDADLVVEQRWRVSGAHYARTSEAWLEQADAHATELRQILAGAPERSFQRWRMFFLACAEFFSFRGGEEWFVTHARLRAR